MQDIHNELVAAHGDASPNERTVFRWVADIRSGCFELEKRRSPGRPVLTSTAAIVQTVKSLITLTVRLSFSDIASELSVPKTWVFEILTKNVNLRNVYAVWVPHDLSVRNKTARIACW